MAGPPASRQGGNAMPLSNGYGVVIGTRHDYFRDRPDNFGRHAAAA